MSELQHPCIEWEGPRTSKGHGMTRWNVGMNQVGAHRVAYCVEYGLDLDAVKGLLIRHKCDNPACVQPMHLEPGTYQDNMDDKVDRGRSAKGIDHGSNKLTEEQVRCIKYRYVKGCKVNGQGALAREFGVMQSLVYRIVHNELWRHI